jgi:hypothetical protein
MLPWALLVAAALGREPALVDAVKYGDGELASQTMELVLGDAREVALDGGDGEAWLLQGLEQAGLAQVAWEVGGLGGGFTVASCVAEADVICREEPCVMLEARIRCTSRAPVAGVEEPLKVVCGGERAIVERLEDGRLELGRLDRCLAAGALQLELAQLDMAADVIHQSSLLQAIGGAGVGIGHLAHELDDAFAAEDPFAGLGGVSGVGSMLDHGGGGGGGAIRIAQAEAPPPPDPWPGWGGVQAWGEPVQAPNEALAIRGDEILAAEDDELVRVGLEDGVERGRIALGGYRQGREIDELCVSPDGTRLGVVWGSVGLDTDGGAYELWGLEHAEPVVLASEQTRWSVHHCAFTADGRWFAVGARQGLWVFDASSGVKRRSVGQQGDMLDQVTLLAAAPKGDELLLLWGYERLAVLKAATGKERRVGPYESLPLDAVWLPGDVIVLADDGTVVLDADGARVASGPGAGLDVVAVGPDRLLVTDHRGPVLLGMDGEVLGGLGGPARLPEAIAASPDGAWIVVGTWEGLLRYRVAPAR